MGIKSDVLGLVNVEQRFVGDDTADWTISTSAFPTDKQVQSLMNFASAVGGVIKISREKQKNHFRITVAKTFPEKETEIVKEVIRRFVNVVDGGARQTKETPLAENSSVPVYGHHEQD